MSTGDSIAAMCNPCPRTLLSPISPTVHITLASFSRQLSAWVPSNNVQLLQGVKDSVHLIIDFARTRGSFVKVYQHFHRRTKAPFCIRVPMGGELPIDSDGEGRVHVLFNSEDGCTARSRYLKISDRFCLNFAVIAGSGR